MKDNSRALPQADRAFVPDGIEPVPVSPAVAASIPSADDLWASLCYLGKWIERGMFDKQVTPQDALGVMAHYPGMPWNSKRWDVDHKSYAAAYYKAFPRTAAQGAEARQGGDGEAGSVHDGPVAESHAPKSSAPNKGVQ